MIYSIDKSKISEIKIFKPGTTLDKWYAKQKVKPYMVCNASLYNMTTRIPIGTIIEDGKMVENEGNGFGIGTLKSKEYGFGKPWDKQWDQYITGYYGIVQNGVAIDPPFSDAGVFNRVHHRIAIAENQGQISICTLNSSKIKPFAEYCKGQGMISAINLDGGGSRHLIVDGKEILSSVRVPYNAIAIYTQSPTEAAVNGGKSLKVICTHRTSTLDSSGKVESGRYIDKGDLCTIDSSISNSLLIKITYPSGSLARTAYIKNLGCFTPAT